MDPSTYLAACDCQTVFAIVLEKFPDFVSWNHMVHVPKKNIHASSISFLMLQMKHKFRNG